VSVHKTFFTIGCLNRDCDIKYINIKYKVAGSARFIGEFSEVHRWSSVRSSCWYCPGDRTTSVQYNRVVRG